MKERLFYRAIKEEWLTIVRGEGEYLFDSSGRRFLDACSGIYVANIGHAVPEIGEAMAEQARKVSFVHQLSFLNEPLLELARKLTDSAPPGMTRAFFVSSGSEGVESAIKMARKYHIETGNPDRHKVISRWQSWHGNTIGALSVSGRNSFQKDYGPYLMNVPKISPPYCTSCGYGVSCRHVDPYELERLIKQEGKDSISAFIAEPIPGGSAAAMMPHADYYRAIREICDRNGVLMVMDEVVTGFGRSGKTFAIDHWKVVPDIIVTGKGLACGYAPIAALLTTEKVFEGVCRRKRNFMHGHTYSGNPQSCAVALAVQEYISRNRLIENCAARGVELKAMLDEALSDVPIVGEVRGAGLLLGIEFSQDKKFRRPFEVEKQITTRVVKAALDRGLLIQPGGPGSFDGVLGDHVVVAPPFTVRKEQLREIVEPLREAIEAVSNLTQ